MKRFIVRFLGVLGIPLILLFVIFQITDPFKTLKSFSLKNISTVNREYLSMELYLKNKNRQNYNSFLFGSSKGGGFNSYQWKSYLPTNSNQFVFQAWHESITGIYQKISFIDKNNESIKNVIILLDIPSSFADIQEPKTALCVKHYLLSGKTYIYYQGIFFYSILKPSKIFKSIKESFIRPKYSFEFDTISNDWNKLNKDTFSSKPIQDKTLDKSKFYNRPDIEIFSDEIIKPKYQSILKKIKSILIKQKTAYKIIIAPDYSQIRISKNDLRILKNIFGEENVYNYSGQNLLTEDMYNFTDINHFDASVGWEIIEDIYNKNQWGIKDNNVK